jgi:hypothetical protein
MQHGLKLCQYWLKLGKINVYSSKNVVAFKKKIKTKELIENKSKHIH